MNLMINKNSPPSPEKGENVTTPAKTPKPRRKAVKKRIRANAAPPMATHVKDGILISQIPIVTVSESNTREHWSVSARRHKRQKLLVRLALNGHVCQLQPPYHVNIVRYSPGTLDGHDNLPTSLKYITDAIAEMLFPGLAAGRADNDPRITWHFNQTRSPVHFVWIRIESLSMTKELTTENQANP